MKRAIAGKGRRGAPPLPRQRMALRVVQVTLVALAASLVRLAALGNGIQERVGLASAAIGSVSFAVWMGIRTVRGPRPPSID